MYKTLEIHPTDRLDYLLVSLHPGDVSRAANGLQLLELFGVPLRLAEGENRGEQIRQCHGLLLILSKTALQEPAPQARSDYRLAQRYGKPVYVFLLEDISLGDIPTDTLHWWLELRNEPCVDDWNSLVHRLQGLYGPLETADDRDPFFAQYLQLCHRGKFMEAQAMLSGFLFRKSPGARADALTQVLSRSIGGQATSAPLYKENAFRHWYKTDEKKPLTIDGSSFYAKTRTVFRRTGRGDADVIDIFRDGECIFTVPHLVEAWGVCMIPSDLEDVIHVCFTSYPDVDDSHKLSNYGCLSVVIIEHPCEKPRFHVFMDPYCRMGFRPD